MSQAAERAHWDDRAGDDPHTFIRHGNWHLALEADLQEIACVGDVGPILDLGCGVGRLTNPYALMTGATMIGVDIAQNLLDIAHRGRPYVPVVHYLQCDGRTLPKLPALGGAFSMLMFQHIPKAAQESYVGQVGNLLQPGARFVFQTVTGSEDVFLSHQVHPFEPADWCEDAGLQVESVRQGDPVEWQWVTARKVNA